MKFELPNHWKIESKEEKAIGFFGGSDKFRDYSKPRYLHESGNARIYYNRKGPDWSPDCAVAIIYPWHGSGDCVADLETAIRRADEYLEKHPTS